MADNKLHKDLLSMIPFSQSDTSILDQDIASKLSLTETRTPNDKIVNELVNEEEKNKTVITIKTGSQDWILILIFLTVLLLILIILTVVGILTLQEVQYLRTRIPRNF
jgi:hypothetical protein